MTITLSDGITTLHPFELRASYSSKRDSGNQFHVHVNGAISATLAAAQPRSGTLQFLFEVEADSLACEQLLNRASTFTIADTTRTSYNMTFASKSIARALDSSSGEYFTVSVDYQELS